MTPKLFIQAFTKFLSAFCWSACCFFFLPARLPFGRHGYSSAFYPAGYLDLKAEDIKAILNESL